MSNKFPLADVVEMDKRKEASEEFVRFVISAEERPQFVSDEACLYDISSDEEATLSARCHQQYGVGLTREHFSMPIWQLLDHLDKVRTIRTYRRSEIDRIYRR